MPLAVKVAACGEPMVEFKPSGGATDGSTSRASAAAAQGARVRYFSALGDDAYGRMLRALCDETGMDHADVSHERIAATRVIDWR